MKKILIAVLVVSALFAVSHYERHYTRKNCRVIEVNAQWVKCKDFGGNVWAFSNDGTFEVGDRADLKMYDNKTDSYIYDDEIVKVVRAE